MCAATWSSPKPTRQWALGFCLLAGLLAPCAWAQTTVSVSRVQITSSAGTDDTYAIGDVIVAQATFTEPVWVTNSPSLTLALTTPGTVEALYRNGSGSRVLRFEYIVRRGDVDGDGVSIPSDAITLGAADGIVDQDGDAATLTHDALAADEDHQVDGVPPQVTAIAAVSPAGNHAAGDYIDFDVTFDDDIITTGNVELVVTFGTTSATLGDPPTDPQSRRAQLIVQPRQSGRVLRFRYIVQTADQDSDGISVEPDALSGGTIRDATGNPADRTVLRTTWATHTVDAAPPAVIGVDVTSRPRSGDTYRAGETIDVGVTFDEEVYVSGNPQLAIGIDSSTQQAAYISGSGTRTLTFSYTVQAGDRDDDGISIGPDALTGGVIEDAAGTNLDADARRITPLPVSGGHKVDGGDVVTVSVSSPRVTSSPASGTSYQTGEVIRVAITFSARVFVAEEIDEPDPIDHEPLSLLLAIGEHSRAAAFESGSGTPTLTFRYIVAAEDYDDAGISIPPGRTSLQGGVIEDADGNAAPRNFPGVASLTRHRVNAGGNGVPPRVESVTIRPRTGRQPYPPYGPGERIEVDVTFSERVYVSEAADELELLLSIGTETRAAHYLAGSGTTTLRFRYVVQATDRDDDGISIGPGVSVDDENARTPGSLVGGVIEDADGNLALRDFQAKEANRDHRVGSGVEGPPAIDEVAISSFPGAGNPYRPGDPIEVTITFSETVFVVEQPLQLMLSIGPNLRPADYQTGSGTDRLVFRYVAQAGDQDDDGISIGPGPGSLVGGPIQDADGNDASRDFAALPAQEAHKVAPQPATAPTVQITSDPEGPYRAGDAIEVTVTFPETVFVVRQPLQVMLSIGPNLRAADYQRGSGSNQLEFRYVVQADDQDDDGVSIGPGPGALAGGAIQDADGNDAPRDFAALPANAAHKVGSPQRAAMPTAQITSETQGPYRPGDAIEVTVTFPETVFVVQQPLRLMLSIGPNLRAADYQTGSGTPQLVFSYVVQAGDQDDDGVSIGPGPGALAGGAIQDADGNDAPRDFAALPPDPQHKVGPTAPTVQITSETQGPYRAGDAIEVTVTFSETVFVVRQPLQLMLSIGPNLRAADYQRGSGSDQLVFSYVVQAGDQDDDGVSIGPGPGALAGGAIQDADGNDAPRDFAALPANAAHKVGSPQRAAMPTAQITSETQGPYRPGDAIEVTVTFPETVFVVRQPLQVMLSIGPNLRAADYQTGSGTPQLVFSYVVQAGDQDDDGVSIGPGPGALAGGAIQDADGNDAPRDFAALPPDPQHKVGPTAPTVQITSETQGPYRAGDAIEVTVTFSETVFVVRQPLQLMLSIGPNLRAADYQRGSGSNQLVFSYVVQAGDQDDDGVSIGPGPGALAGGAIQDADGNDAPRDFAALPANAAHKVGSPQRAAMPTAQITSETQGPYRPGDAIEVTVTFSETVFVVQQPLRLMLSIGPNLRAADYHTGSGTPQLVFRYVVQAGDQDDDGVSIGPGPGALAGGPIQHSDGGDAPRDFAALPPDPQHKVGSQQQQVAAPTVAITSSPDADDTYLSGEAIEVTVTFSTPVFVSGSPPPAVALLIGPDRRLASYARGGSSPDELIFRYTVQRGDRDEDGISIGPGRDALTGGVIEDEQGNAAVRDFAALRDDAEHMVAGGPSATGVAITSSPATGDTYAPGEDIVVAVTFDGAVRVTERTRLKLALRVGERLRNADFIGGSGTSTLRFRYTVQHGDQDVDGISIDPMALVNGGIQDAAGSDAVREFEELPDQRGHKVGAAVVVTAALDRLVVGGAPRQVPLGTLLTQTGLSYRGGFAEPEVDTPNVVDATLAGAPGQPILTVSAIAEGTANIVVTARNAAITLIFTVSVGADAAEAAVLEDALASVGRGLLSSASDVIGGRLRPDRAPSEKLVVPNRRGYPRRPPSHFAGQGGAAADNGSDSLRWLSAAERLHPDPNNPQRGMAAEQLLSMLAFDMPFLGERGGSTGFSFWGAGDMRRFSGDPEEGGYDGDLAVAYLGIDARGGDWVAGAAVAHSRGDANYDAMTANGKIEGTLETELTAFHPYAQWRLNDRAEAWAIFGFGQGEATHTRKDLGYVDAPSDLTMAMGLAGARGILGSGLGFDLALHGDAGMIRLETADDGGALNELSLSMQRARVGVEAAYPLALAGGRYSIAPFLDVAARYDGGDGQTGAGIEVAAGVRYDGPIVSFEAKARSLVWHGADGYSESGASAAIVVEPGSQDGRGLRLSLAPRWGGASNSMDVFWRHSAFGAQRRWRSAAERGWGLGGRVSYGFGLSTLPGAITPFADFDFAGATRRARLGVGYGVSSPWGVPLRIDLSGERMEDDRGADHRFLLSGEALF